MISSTSRGLRLASGLLLAIGAAGFATSGHAQAAGNDVPGAQHFYWQVQLQNVSIAGVSPDLPSAMNLAGLGLTLTDTEKSYIATSLTAQALAEGVPTTVDAPAASLTVAPPAPATVVVDNSGE
jgi:hypothetical protein